MTHGDYDPGHPWPSGPADPENPYGAPPPGYYNSYPRATTHPARTTAARSGRLSARTRNRIPPAGAGPWRSGRSSSLSCSLRSERCWDTWHSGRSGADCNAAGTSHWSGLTLSYTFIVLTVAGLAMWMVTGAYTRRADQSDRPDVIAVPDPAHAEAPSARPAPDALTGVLLSLDELKSILKAPGLAETPSSSGESQGGDDDARADPAECAGAVAAGLDTVYDSSGATGYTRVGYSDPRTATLLDQVAASFASAADARDFVAQSAGQWRQCAGKSFSISTSSGPGLTWDLGTVVVEGDRATLRNTLTTRQGLPQYRILAAKGNVVIDLSILAKELGDQPGAITDQMLARVPG